MIKDVSLEKRCPFCGRLFKVQNDRISHKQKAKIGNKTYRLTTCKCGECEAICTLQVDDEFSLRLLKRITLEMRKAVDGVQSGKAIQLQNDLTEMRNNLTGDVTGKMATIKGNKFVVMCCE